MSQKSTIPTSPAFSPALQTDDALTGYWMRQVTGRLRREVCWRQHLSRMACGSEEVSSAATQDPAWAALTLSRYWEEKQRFFSADLTAAYLTEQLGTSPPDDAEGPARGSLGWVIQELDLEEAACFALALGLTAAFDGAAGHVIAACLHRPAQTPPTLALAQQLWDDPDRVLPLADPSHPLFTHGLLQGQDRQTPAANMVDWSHPLQVPALVARQLLDPTGPLPQALSALSTNGGEGTADAPVHITAGRILARGQEAGLRIVPVCGPRGADPLDVVRPLLAFTGHAGALLHTDFDLAQDAYTLPVVAAVCWLRGLDLVIDQDLTPQLADAHRRDLILPSPALPLTLYLNVTERECLAHLPTARHLPVLDVPLLSFQDRVDVWRQSLGPCAERLHGPIEECARRFRYQKRTIQAIGRGLISADRPVEAADLMEACQAERSGTLADLAQQVTPRFRDEPLILPPRQQLQFDEIVRAMQSLTEVHYRWGTAQAWNEGGISVLFAGPPGTGKTMGAERLAILLGLPLYRVDLSQVMDKYVGETEKRLKRIFDTADISDIILFFDEADALFGRRTEVKTAHDRYANLEVSYLLERMERFKGLAILATNRKKDLDIAFLRRLRYIVDFPIPDEAQRRRLWRQMIPPGVDGSSIDVEFLSRAFQLTGGHIRSIVFNACLQSAAAQDGPRDGRPGRLTMASVVVALKRELDKMNQSVGLERFGTYAPVVQALECCHEEP